MAKRKKYPKLPNGYGSIKYLGKNRRNPYAVHPPTEEFNDNGIPQTPKALCYVDDWMVGFAVLTAHKAGNYYPGMEQELQYDASDESKDILTLAGHILANYNQTKGEEPKPKEKTFQEIYDDFYSYKFEHDKAKVYSSSTKYSIKAAFKNCSTIHNKPFRTLKHDDLQQILDNCKLSYSSMELIVNLLRQMYAYAEIYELCDKDYSKHLKINIVDDDEHGEPFTDKDLQILWYNRENEIVEFLLIMIYSGYRITAYRTLKVDLRDRYFQGGIKTASSKNRVVPIHPAIFPLVQHRMNRLGNLLPNTPSSYRTKMYATLEQLGITKHTPHDCRHTFSALCEKYKVNENDRKRMLGHSFGNDLTNGTYGHRSIDELRSQIEKIKVCY